MLGLQLNRKITPGRPHDKDFTDISELSILLALDELLAKRHPFCQMQTPSRIIVAKTIPFPILQSIQLLEEVVFSNSNIEPKTYWVKQM